MNSNLFQVKHELWLKMVFASFAISDDKIKDTLYDFSNILFRHLKWITEELKEKNSVYNYNKSEINIEKKTNHDYLKFLISQLEETRELYDDSLLFKRILEDEKYFISKLNLLLETSQNQEITAFNKKRVYEDKNLSKPQVDALTYFLFEETYKEYELILVYFYMQNYTDNITLYNVYQDLIDESHFHLKSFGNMLAKMGILSIPRVILKSIYTTTDIKQFLIDGIAEEEGAKEECRKLAEAVEDEELSKFFDFINYQESYHISLMEKALERF